MVFEGEKTLLNSFFFFFWKTNSLNKTTQFKIEIIIRVIKVKIKNKNDKIMKYTSWDGLIFEISKKIKNLSSPYSHLNFFFFFFF